MFDTYGEIELLRPGQQWFVFGVRYHGGRHATGAICLSAS